MRAKACAGVNLYYPARASLWARPVRASAWPGLGASVVKYALPGWWWRQQRTAACAKAPRRGTVPLCLPAVPRRLPAAALAHLPRRQQGRKEEARQIQAEIYGWCTEGFDTADLKEAKALLEELKGLGDSPDE